MCLILLIFALLIKDDSLGYVSLSLFFIAVLGIIDQYSCVPCCQLKPTIRVHVL